MLYEELLQRTASLPYQLPTERNRLMWLADQQHEVEEHARGVRPILHGRLVVLIKEFLEHKRAHGSSVERALYEGMDCVAFVTRLLTCRPLAFLTGADSYLLKTGESGAGGFEDIGTDREGKRQRLGALLSYDEMAISAMVGVSVPTHFINDGGRNNRAEPGAPGSFESRGIQAPGCDVCLGLQCLSGQRILAGELECLRRSGRCLLFQHTGASEPRR